jgi:hypothetical protein
VPGAEAPLERRIFLAGRPSGVVGVDLLVDRCMNCVGLAIALRSSYRELTFMVASRFDMTLGVDAMLRTLAKCCVISC